MQRPVVLAIESSCDDTACALVDGGGRVLASAISSQPEIHRPFGGVVPELASREHLVAWPRVWAAAFERSGVGLDAVDAFAATAGPGLVGSLLVGLTLGRTLAWSLGRPFFAVDHLEGHLFSPFLGAPGEPPKPVPERFVGLVVSGGHTSLYEVETGRHRAIAETRDDAIGEAFDKFGKRLGLAYPQGPEVDRLAELGDPKRLPGPRSHGSSELFFSYSGLKTWALGALAALAERGIDVERVEGREPPFAPEVLDLLAAFRWAAVAQILDRLDRCWARPRDRPFDHLAVSGGVAANRLLRRRLPEWAAERGVELALVPLAYAGDNAAMIANVALRRLLAGEAGDDPLTARAASRLAS